MEIKQFIFALDYEGYGGMTKMLYNLSATKKELDDYFFCIDWLDGKNLYITLDDIAENKYYNTYYNYWNSVAENIYLTGDYL